VAIVGGLLAAAPRWNSALTPPTVGQLESLMDFDPVRTPVTPLMPHPPAVPPLLMKPRLAAMFLLDDSNGGLDHFYQALWRTEKKEASAITRILHYGDSPTTADLITGDIRASLQARFGNAGHGFILVAKPWAWYDHRGASVSGSGWDILASTQVRSRDGFYGLGGVIFNSKGSARSKIEYKDQALTRFEIYYLAQPSGGKVTASSGEDQLAAFSTAADAAAPGFEAFTSTEPVRSLEIRAEGTVRLYGITAERAAPGVVYDTIGLNGASITVLANLFNEKHWAGELRHRNPNMVVINYGTNEADFDSFVDHQYEGALREAIRRVRAALPNASILIMSPMDRGKRDGANIVTMDTIPRIVATQRRVASETGCGFFDTFTAMGGAGTMARWYASHPRLVSADFIHPVPAGGKIIADIFAREIESGLARYKLRSVADSTLAAAKKKRRSAVR
jgi:lysophospholipase L1-like esterase